MTKIEWTHRPGTSGVTWNPISGCDPDDGYQSEACEHCWARRMSHRLAGRHGYPESPHQFDVTLHPDKLDAPLRWRKPRTVFVASMGDLFHEDAEDTWRIQVWRVMEKALQHTFIVLTKRPAAMLDWFERVHSSDFGPWPPVLPNVWLGVTAENQKRADERIPLLLQCPAAVRFVSIEPMLEPIIITPHIDIMACFCGYRGFGELDTDPNTEYGVKCPDCGAQRYEFGLASTMPDGGLPTISWVIVGGETGPGARTMDPGWAREIKRQCQEAGTPFFFKQMSKKAPIPDDLMIRQWPSNGRI